MLFKIIHFVFLSSFFLDPLIPEFVNSILLFLFLYYLLLIFVFLLLLLFLLYQFEPLKEIAGLLFLVCLYTFDYFVLLSILLLKKIFRFDFISCFKWELLFQFLWQDEGKWFFVNSLYFMIWVFCLSISYIIFLP